MDSLWVALIDLIWLLDIQYDSASTEHTALVEFVDRIIENEWISMNLLYEKLDAEFLEAIGLVQSQQSWTKKLIRVNTQMLYKQQKYNLLREESEGYSKIITVVQEACLKTKIQTESEMVSLLDTIQSLIGYFDLDPNRTLEILLGVFIENLSSYRFFIKLFQKSVWFNKDGTSFFSDRSVLANIFGFQLTAHSKANKDVSKNLFIAAALLIVNGLMDLNEIYAHLSPSDEMISQQTKEVVAKMRSDARAVGVVSLASVSLDDIEPDVKDVSPVKEKEPPVKMISNQKANLVEALFTVGDWARGLMTLYRQPKLRMLNTDMAGPLYKCIHWMIEPVYSNLRPSAGWTRMNNSSATNQSQDIFPILPTSDEFTIAYYEDWVKLVTSTIPQSHDMIAIKENVFPIIFLLGPQLSCDVSLLTKLIRIIGKECLGSEKNDMDFALKIISSIIFPCISRISSNTGVVNEVWELLKALPYKTRYTLYGEWKNNVYESHPLLFQPKSQSIYESKKILRRISKDNVKQLGRQLAKLTHANPVVCFSAILDQIQVYENLIVPIVDSLRYVTELGLDVLCYLLIDALAQSDKERVKSDGTNLSMWLNSKLLSEATVEQFNTYISRPGCFCWKSVSQAPES